MAGRAVILHDRVDDDAAPDSQDTLVQVEAVGTALGALGYRVETLALGADLLVPIEGLRRRPPEIVFNLVESYHGHGRLNHLIPMLLDANELRFSGSDGTALMLTSAKPVAKAVMRAAGVPTADWLDTLESNPGLSPGDGPWIVKSVWEHASLGMDEGCVVDSWSAALALALAREQSHGGQWFSERYVDGREFNVGMLAGPHGPEILPIAEMRFVDFPPGAPRIVDYAAKWEAESFAYQHTRPAYDFAPGDAALLQRLEALAIACWKRFDLNGYARVDFRVDGDGEPWVLEVNANPCLSPDAGFARAAGRRGLDLCAVTERILTDARERAHRRMAVAA